MRVMLVTGGAGFMGSHFIRYFLKRNKNFIIINIDHFANSGDADNLRDLQDSPRYHFVKGDICNAELVFYVLRKYRPEYIINFASEPAGSSPLSASQTSMLGTCTLLEGAKGLWKRMDSNGKRFIQVSSVDVYGKPAAAGDYLLEESPVLPETPWTAVRAGADLLAASYARTYKLPVIITRGCSSYGPCQEKNQFIPACICKAQEEQPILLQDGGNHLREWMHVQDHCIALIRTLFYGKPGEIYNFGSGEEITDLELARKILKLMGKPDDLISAGKEQTDTGAGPLVNSYKARSNLSWAAKFPLEDGLADTIQWYEKPDK